MNISDVQLFLTITETSSLSQAAKRMEISPMAVSRRLAAMEQELGVRLVQRTTRSVSLTQEGTEFLPYAKSMVEAEDSAKALFHPGCKGASGLLRVTVPSGFGRRNIIPLIPDLLSSNPELRIDLQLSETIVDIVGMGIDVAIRIAPLKDSSLIGRKIVDNPRIVVASPGYLKQFGRPKSMSALTDHNCLRLTNVPQWTFEVDGQPTSMTVEGRLSSSSVEGTRELCIAGLGIAQLTYWDVEREVAAGELVEIHLEDVKPQNLAVYALLPTARYLPQRVIAFIDALKASLSEQQF